MINQSVIPVNGIHKAIAELQDPGEAKDLYNKLQALHKVFKEKRGYQNEYAWGALNAARAGGFLLREDEDLGRKGRGGNRYKKLQKSHDAISVVEKYELTLSTSSRWQSLTYIPQDEWETYGAELLQSDDRELTMSAFLEYAKEFKRQTNGSRPRPNIQLPDTGQEDCLYKDDWTQAWVGDAANLYFIQDDTVDLIVTSPPYNIGPKNGKGRKLWHGVNYDTDSDQKPESDYQRDQIKILDELWRVTRPGGSLFYNHKIRNRKGIGIHPFAWISQSKWTFRQQITWDRGSTHNKEMSYFWPHDELIFWLTKGADDVYLSPEGAKMSTVWRFNFQMNTNHPAPFPVELPKRCIIAASKPGDLILDPFAGSFTTCLAAKELGRYSIGVDISTKYVNYFSQGLYQEVLQL